MLQQRLALLVAYDGTPYRGWTDVRDGALRPTLARVLGLKEPPLLEAASRTDAGVHAHGQVCSLSLEADGSIDVGQLAYSLNQLLPPEVAVKCAALQPGDFDVRSNVGKLYQYRFNVAPCRDPLTRLQQWHVPLRRGQVWDAQKAAAFAEQLRGRHRFAAFGNRPRGTERHAEVDPTCTLSEVLLAPALIDPTLESIAHGSWRVTVRGDRFLYKMVRNLVGAIVRVGVGEISSEECLEALEHGAFARSASVPLTAPAHGLCLWHVDYAVDPFQVDE